MSDVVLVQAQPRNSKTGALVDVRLAGGGSRPYDQLGYMDWRGGLASLPRFSTTIGFEQGGWNGAALPQTGALRFFPAGDVALVTELSDLNWNGARVVVSLGDDEVGAASYRRVFVGTASACTQSRGALNITLQDLSKDLEKPAAPDTFAGTGGLEGGDEATGRIKRRTFGVVFNVEGRLLDKANSIYEFSDPGRPLRAFRMVKDKGAAAASTVTVDWQGSALATLNALRSTAAPGGGCAVAPSIACVKWWTTPGGPLTADIEGESTGGYVSTAASIAERVVSIYAPSIAVLNTAGANGWKGYTVGVHIEDASETAANVLDRLLLPLGLVWIMGADGVLAFRRFTWDNPVETIEAEVIERVTSYQPLRTRRLGFQRNYRQHTDAEINATLLLATDATYADGTPIEVLKPAQAGADVTGRNTASAIIGQGLGATAPQKDIFNSFLSISASGLLTGGGGGQVTYPGIGGKALGLLDQLFFGSPYLTESAGGPVAGLNAFKTALGIASGFSGQGPLASMSSILYGSSYLTGLPRAISPSAFFPSGFMYASEIYGNDGGRNLDVYFPVTTGSDKTSGATAAGFLGQGILASLNVLGPGQVGFQTGGGNMVRNPSFEVAGPGDPNIPCAGFLPYDNGANGDTKWYRALGGRRAGTYSLLTTWTTATVHAKGFYTGTAGTVDNFGIMQARRTYMVSFYARASGAAIGRAIILAWNTAPERADVVSNPALAGVYQRYVFRLKWGENVDPNLFIAIEGNVGQGAWEADDFQIEEGDTVTAFSPSFLSGEVGLPYLKSDAVRLGTNIVRADGVTSATDNALVTSLGIASGFQGQGGLATRQYVNLGIEGVGGVARANDMGYHTEATLETIKGVSAGFSGQTPFATLASGTSLDNPIFGLPERMQASTFGPTWFRADRIAWASGNVVENLKPEEAGGNRTEGRTSAGITGQGLLATTNYVKLGHPSTNPTPGYTNLIEENTNYYVTNYQAITSQGVASAISGQGALATQSSVSYTDQISALPRALQQSAFFPSGYMYASEIYQNAGAKNLDTYFPEDVNSNRTEARTSAAISGQGAFATLNRVSMSNTDRFNHDLRFASSPQHGAQYFAASAVAFAAGETTESLRPGEAGANVTERRTASAIVGQSGFATAAGLTRDQVFSGGFFNYNAFSLGYTVTRSDGVSTVTEQLVVTQVGVAAGFAGQGALASKNNAGYNELDVATLTAQTDDAVNGIFGGDFNTPVTYVPNFGKDMAIKSGGTIYASFSGGSGNTNAANTAVYNSIEILDAADNSVLASVRLPYGAPGTNRLDNYIVMVPNRWGFRTIRWRVATRGSAGSQPNAASNVTNPQMTVQWKAL